MPNRLFFAQILAHLSLIPMLIWATPKHYAAAFLVYFLTGCLGMSMTYHRLVTHRSWRAPDWFLPIGLFFATIGLTGSCISWSATHAQHHKYSDKDRDPHSPYKKGFLRVQFLSMLEPIKLSWIRPFIKNPQYKFFHRYYWQINLAYLAALLLIQPFSVVYLYLVPACLLWHGGSFINTVGHRFGKTRFELPDESRNNFLLGIFMWGEGWHNNHHRYPKNSYYGQGWFEVDISGLLIKIIRVRDEKKVLSY